MHQSQLTHRRHMWSSLHSDHSRVYFLIPTKYVLVTPLQHTSISSNCVKYFFFQNGYTTALTLDDYFHPNISK